MSCNFVALNMSRGMLDLKYYKKKKKSFFLKLTKMERRSFFCYTEGLIVYVYNEKD